MDSAETPHEQREAQAVGNLLAENSSGPLLWPPEELPQTPPSPPQHAPRSTAPSNGHSPTHTTSSSSHRISHAPQQRPPNTRASNNSSHPTSSSLGRRRSHAHAPHVHPPTLSTAAAVPHLDLGLGALGAGGVAQRSSSTQPTAALRSSADALPHQDLAGGDSSSGSHSPVPLLGVSKAPTSPRPGRQHAQHRHHHHQQHQQLQQQQLNDATPQGTGHANGQLNTQQQLPTHDHSQLTTPGPHSPQASLHQQQHSTDQQQHFVHSVQHTHRDAVPLHPWLTPPQLYTRWWPPPLEQPSNADLSPSVTRISPPPSPSAGFSTARHSPSSAPQNTLSKHLPRGSSRIASAAAGTLGVGKPVPVSMRKLATQQAHMRDPINMLLDRFQITHALESHHHELQAWHAKHLEKQRQQQQHRHSARGSCSGLSLVNGKAGDHRPEKDSKACDPYSGTPIGAYLFKPEYSFAGSQPLKSDPGTCVLFERHPSTDPGLPPLQRCYLRAERNMKVQQQEQQRKQRELQERKQRQQEREQRQLAAMQQQQQQHAMQGAQGVQGTVVSEQGLVPEEGGHWGSPHRHEQRQEGQHEVQELCEESSTKGRAGRRERPTSCSLKALPNGVPISRLEYMHSLENRVAFTMASRAAAKQQLQAEQQGYTDTGPPLTHRTSPPRTTQRSAPRTSAASPTSPTQRRPEWPPFSPSPDVAVASGAHTIGGAGSASLRHSMNSAPAHAPAAAPAHACASYAQQLSSSSGGGTSETLRQLSTNASGGGGGGGGALSKSTSVGGGGGGGGGSGSLKSPSGGLRLSHSAASSGADRSRRGLQSSSRERKGQPQGYGTELLVDTAAARAAFGVARALRPGTAEPLLDEDFYKTVHSHFLNLTGAQTAELQGDLNASLPQIIESFGIVQR